MKNIQSILLTLIITSFISCNENATETNTTDNNTIVTLDTNNTTENTQASTEYIADTATQIRFEDFTIIINRLIVWDDVTRPDIILNDTANLYIELGETIEGQTIEIANNKWTDIKVEQRYETSITIMNEGPPIAT